MAKSRPHDLDGLLGRVFVFGAHLVFVVESRLPSVPLRSVSGYTLPRILNRSVPAGCPAIYRQNVLHIETPAGDVRCTVELDALPEDAYVDDAPAPAAGAS